MNTVSALRGKQSVALRAPSLSTLFETPFPPREHIIAPWLRAGESAMVWAPTGVGKTMFSLTLALGVAGGGSVFGWTFPRPQRVLIVEGEMNTADLVDRSKMLLQTVEGINAEEAARNITVMARQYQDPDAEFPDLATPEGRDEVFERARTGRYDLVILDNFSTLATVDDENAAAAMNPVLAFLMRMKQANIACLLVHHSGKSEASFRGSSKLATTFEVIIGLHRIPGQAARHGTAFNIVWDKYRGKRDDGVRGRRAALEECSRGHLRWNHELSTEEECDDLVEAVKSLRYATQEELAKALGCSTGKLSKLKARAIHTLRLVTEADWDECLKAARTLRDEDVEGQDLAPDF